MKRKIGKKEQLLRRYVECMDLTEKINFKKKILKELEENEKERTLHRGLRLEVLLLTCDIRLLENFRRITVVKIIELRSQIKKPGKRLRELLPGL